MRTDSPTFYFFRFLSKKFMRVLNFCVGLQKRIRRPVSPRSLAALLALATVALLAAACRQSPPIAPTVAIAPVAAMAENAFLGDAACASCHQAAFRSHAASAHANTLHTVNPALKTRWNPPLGRIARTNLTVETLGGNFVVTPDNQLERAQAVQFALGSGKSGITYTLPLDDARILEMRQSYYPRLKIWHVTPGQENIPAGPLSAVRRDGRQCIQCHAVTLPSFSLVTEPRFQGVGCESCHGAGGAHVAAMRAGNLNAGRMEKLGGWGAARLNTLCGACHGTAEKIGRMAGAEHLTHRFQPFGLALSKCFQASGDRLSCLTCHDPHADASHNARGYENACLKCHAPTAATTLAAVSTGKACPVSPKSGCLPCHMPRRKIIPAKEIPDRFADHRIAIYPPGAGEVKEASARQWMQTRP